MATQLVVLTAELKAESRKELRKMCVFLEGVERQLETSQCCHYLGDHVLVLLLLIPLAPHSSRLKRTMQQNKNQNLILVLL